MRRNSLRGSALVLALAVVVGACSWPTVGHDAARTGNNPLERTLTLGNVAQLEEAWSADAPGTSPPVVVGNDVYVAGPDLRVYSANGTTGCAGTPRVCVPVWSASGTFAGSPTVAGDDVFVMSTAGSLAAYDVHAVTGCAGTPKVCTPVWTASIGTSAGTFGSPAVSDGVVYAGGDALEAFDAAGVTGCSGVPRVCQPLWTAPRLDSFSGSSTPSIANGVVYAVANSALGAYDAHGISGCSGTPKTCAPLWVFHEPHDFCGNCSLLGPPSIIDGRAYVLDVICCSGGRSEMHLLQLDAAGQEGCSGQPTVCQALADATTDTDLGFHAGRMPLAGGDGSVYLGDDDLQVFARDGLASMWRSGQSQGTVGRAAGRVRRGRRQRLRRHTAAVRSRVVRTGGAATEPLAALDSAVAAPTVVNGTVFVRTDRLRAYRLPPAPAS